MQIIHALKWKKAYYHLKEMVDEIWEGGKYELRDNNDRQKGYLTNIPGNFIRITGESSRGRKNYRKVNRDYHLQI
jgi:hypothetical protein